MSFAKLAEADRLLEELASWSEDEIRGLPLFYREEAWKYRKLLKQGDPE